MRVQNGNIITYTGTLAQNKEEALEIVKNRLEEDLKTRVFNSSLGFPVQNRRFETKNDLQNIDSLIFVGVAFYRDANDVNQEVTLQDLNTIKAEMIQDGLAMYQAKFDKEARINLATTKEAVWNRLDE
jgi:hypothetical protein